MPPTASLRRRLGLLPALAAMLMGASAFAADPGKLTVKVDQPGIKISPMLYGLMTEEINHAYDGGLYAELIQNRAFLDAPTPPAVVPGTRGTAAPVNPPHWTVVAGGPQQGGGFEFPWGTIALDHNDPVNTTALRTSLRLNINRVGTGQFVGVANDGFWGIPVKPNTEYRASFYARRSADFSGPLKVDIESNNGTVIHAAATIPNITTSWKKYTVTLKTGEATPGTNNRFVISGGHKGSVWLSLVSLFPPTYNNRPNGNRVDLMEALVDMKPAFLRFPGGNYLEGNEIWERVNWKETIGPLEQRPGHMCPWGYRSSDGMGLLEFLEWCEDCKMEPLLGVFAGYALRGSYIAQGPALEPYIQEALEEIEYVIGDRNTRWGAQRAKDGHPAPFKLTYVEIGNEDWFDQSGSYDGRFAQFYDAIKAKYPKLQLIASTPVKSRKPDVIDDHYYRSARAMQNDVHHYDKADRNGPKIFVGEWASTEGTPTPTLQAALGDAAWLTGLERNSDLIVLSCYAPLLVNVNQGASQWGTNLIGYNALTSFGSPSYYVQQMFNKNRGDTVLPVDLTVQSPLAEEPAKPPHGGIGVGTWATDAEYKDLKVTGTDGTVLFESADFSKGVEGWRRVSGEWRADEGSMHQTGTGTDCRITTGNPAWTDYTYTLKARKNSGNEGFLVVFNVLDNNNYIWFNVGGWNNTRTAMEIAEKGSRHEIGKAVDMKVENGRWYDLKVESRGDEFKCYIDGKLVTEAKFQTEPIPPSMFATASRDDSTGDVIVKVVNIAGAAQQMDLTLQGVSSVNAAGSSVEVISGRADDINNIQEPERVTPKKSGLNATSPKFTHEFPPQRQAEYGFSPRRRAPMSQRPRVPTSGTPNAPHSRYVRKAA